MDEDERIASLRLEVDRFSQKLARLESARKRGKLSSYTPGPPIESGAAKRASMDLTRALACYRQGKPVG